MSVELTEAPRANPFKTMIDIVVAPGEAFTALRQAPTWGWAFALTLVLAAIGYVLMLPILQHAFVAGFPQLIARSPQLAQMSPERQHDVLIMQERFLPFGVISVLIFTPIGMLLQTVIMLIFNAVGRGDARFGTLWSAAANIAVPTIGGGYIVAAVVALLRGPASFNTLQSVYQALPTLALAAPDAGVKLTAFLAYVGPFTLYSTALVGIAMTTIARVPKLPAALAATLTLLVPALMAAAFAR